MCDAPWNSCQGIEKGKVAQRRLLHACSFQLNFKASKFYTPMPLTFYKGKTKRKT